MIILPEFSPTRLKLTVSSAVRAELNLVSTFLNEQDIGYTSRPLPKYQGRFGMEFFIAGLRQVQAFQQVLFIRFTGTGKQVKTEFLTSDGEPYCCKKISLDPRDGEQETIHADDDQEALIKCALLAGDRNWTGGVSEQGACWR